MRDTGFLEDELWSMELVRKLVS